MVPSRGPVTFFAPLIDGVGVTFSLREFSLVENLTLTLFAYSRQTWVRSGALAEVTLGLLSFTTRLKDSV